MSIGRLAAAEILPGHSFSPGRLLYSKVQSCPAVSHEFRQDCRSSSTRAIRMVSTAPSQLESAGGSFRFDLAELAGALGDLGVLVPIAVALIVKNGLTPTAVLLPAGLLYVVAGLVYRLPVPVQPLKAFGAIPLTAMVSAPTILPRAHF